MVTFKKGKCLLVASVHDLLAWGDDPCWSNAASCHLSLLNKGFFYLNPTWSVKETMWVFPQQM